MLERMRRATGLRIASFRVRKFQEKVISFPRSIAGVRDLLVIMPFDRRQVLSTVELIDTLRKKFREENLTVVTLEHSQELTRLLPRSQFIHLLASDLTLLYLPRAEVFRRIRRKSYDLAIDLNLDFLIPSAYICKMSDARIRIGFARERADAFFNFQFQPDPAKAMESVYDRLAACLRMF